MNQENGQLGEAPARAQAELDALRAVHRRDRAELEEVRAKALELADEAGQAQHRLVAASRRLEQARQRVAQLEQSTSFRMGQAVAESLRSPTRLLRLPWTLWRIAHARRDPPADVRAPESAAAGEPVSAPKPEPAAVAAFAGVRPELPAHIEGLRIAAVMDDFTKACFDPVCRVESLHAERYEEQLRACDPHLLLVESAWRGEADSWRHMVASRSGELLGLLDMCARRGIPTAFWNKEDPSHFDTFLETARLFDHVFTTDIDSLRRYRGALGHPRVHLLPFACQPRIHHPVVRESRRDGVCFAGSYYHRYPERCADFERMVTVVEGLAPLTIYDRNSDRDDASFAFPPRYAAMLRPALPYARIDEAYKGYRFSLNINTIKQSQTMFARRVFELMACNTVVISNYSRGLRALFGELVVATDDAQTMHARLQRMIEAPETLRALRLFALRKVLAEHTYARRMQHVAQCVLGAAPQLPQVSVTVLTRVRDTAELQAVLAAYTRQRHPLRQLVAIAAADCAYPLDLPGDVRVLRERDARAQSLAACAGSGLVAWIHPDDHYGPDYLADFAMATLYSDAEAFGKSAHFILRDGRVGLAEGARYMDGVELDRRSCVARGRVLDGQTLWTWTAGSDEEAAPPPLRGLALDEFGYCRDGAGAECREVDPDPSRLDLGVDLGTLMRRAAELVDMDAHDGARVVDAGDVNARMADFRATIARRPVLRIEEAGVSAAAGGGDRDRFCVDPAARRSFGEDGQGEYMLGDLAQLQALLETAQYRAVEVAAPGAELSDLLAAFADRLAVRVRLRDADLRAIDAERAPWRELIAGGYPRLTSVLDSETSASALSALLPAPLSPRQWMVA